MTKCMFLNHKCVVCGNNTFRQSTRNKYTNKEKTEGLNYTVRICEKCSNREEFNKIKWKVGK